MTKTRCKFKLSEITEVNWSTGKRLHFTTEYDSSIPEDLQFCKATPSGSVAMYVDNPSALEFFKLGKSYYFDAVEADGQS